MLTDLYQPHKVGAISPFVIDSCVLSACRQQHVAGSKKNANAES